MTTAMPDDTFTVTPYAVEGTVDYGRLLEQFGTDRLEPAQKAQFPDHPLIRRDVFYAERDVDPFLAATRAGQTHFIVTGRGPSGPMHIGHIFRFYFAKRLQDNTGAFVYVPERSWAGN